MEQLLQNVRSNFVYKDGSLYDKDGKDRSTRLPRGYRQIYVDGVPYLLHRLIFFFHNGVFPKIVDHIDGDLFNNRIENLQSCTQSENIAKAKIFKSNKTGYKGVSFHKAANKFESAYYKDNKKYYVGLFDTAEEAFKAREERKYSESKTNATA